MNRGHKVSSEFDQDARRKSKLGLATRHRQSTKHFVQNRSRRRLILLDLLRLSHHRSFVLILLIDILIHPRCCTRTPRVIFSPLARQEPSEELVELRERNGSFPQLSWRFGEDGCTGDLGLGWWIFVERSWKGGFGDGSGERRGGVLERSMGFDELLELARKGETSRDDEVSFEALEPTLSPTLSSEKRDMVLTGQKAESYRTSPSQRASVSRSSLPSSRSEGPTA